jgi:hypothetical protein
MSIEDHKALMRRYFDFLNQTNLPSEDFLSSGTCHSRLDFHH